MNGIGPDARIEEIAMPVHPPRERAGGALQRRLLPLNTAAFLQGFMLWPPIEKLFMTEIGFDAAAVAGNSAGFEQRLGRIRLVEAIALVSSSLLGGRAGRHAGDLLP